MADVTHASAAAADGNKRGRVAEFDFSFGFLNAQFSDCSLVLTNLLSPDEKQELAVLPVCSLLLASKSDYFKRLFAGGFKESVEKRRVEIGINPDDVDAFRQLLHFIYTNQPDENFKETVHSYFQVAFLADRFHVRECVVTCAERLQTLIEEADHAVALEFLELEHEHISELNRVARASEGRLLSWFTPYLSHPKHPSLMGLRLSGLMVLAKSPELQVASEDVIATRIMEWIKVNTSGETSLDAYVQVLWKHVRICRLSPVAMGFVVRNTLKAMNSSGLDGVPRCFHAFLRDSLRQALNNVIDLQWGRDHTIQLATLCVTMLAQAGLMSPAEAISFTAPQRNECRAGYQTTAQVFKGLLVN